jgi:hypothetical protein
VAVGLNSGIETAQLRHERYKPTWTPMLFSNDTSFHNGGLTGDFAFVDPHESEHTDQNFDLFPRQLSHCSIPDRSASAISQAVVNDNQTS